MRVRPNSRTQALLLVPACLVLAVAAAWLMGPRADAQEPRDLGERIRFLRSEVAASATDEKNFTARNKTLVDWGCGLFERTRFFPHEMAVELVRLQRDNFNPVKGQSLDYWVKALGFIEDHMGKMGGFVLQDEAKLVAGEYTTLRMEYTVGDVEIPAGTVVRIGYHWMTDWPRWQVDDPKAEAYVTFHAPPAVRTETTAVDWNGTYGSRRGFSKVPALKILSGTLKKGDKVRILVGDTAQGSRGYRISQRDTDNWNIPLEADLAAPSVFVPLGFIRTRISASAPALINAVVPSVVAVGERFGLRVRVEDAFFNPAASRGMKLVVKLDGKVVGRLEPVPGSPVASLQGLKVDREGGYRFEVATEDGRFKCLSNPVLVKQTPARRVFWGELHGHSGLEEGIGTVPRYYEYARDIAFLDYGSLTAHDAMLLRPAWQLIRRETEKANRPGSFISYMGYEWSIPMTDGGGHHNVFFKNDPGRYATGVEYPRLPQLYEKLKTIDAVDNVLVIPHAHNPGDWNYTDGEVERLVEMFSMHGSFEYFGQRFLRRGYRVGLVGASDDHTGHPGYSPAYISTRNGLAAACSPRLDREGIWSALRSRATYATSGQRMVVDATIGDQFIGGAVRLGSVPEISARVLGTAPIDRIDVIHNQDLEYTRDYSRPDPGGPAAVQIMFHSTTETPEDKLMLPLTGVFWRGWIEVTGGRIRSIEGLGLDHYTDEFHQVSDRKVWFICKTRGDFDGVLLRLSDAPADTKVAIRIAAAEPEAENGGLGVVYRPGGPPEDKPQYGTGFSLAEIADKKFEFKVSPRAFVYARTAKPDASFDVSFRYRPTKPPAQDDYYYLRVVQLDGEAAWTSPVWIGEATSAKKATSSGKK